MKPHCFSYKKHWAHSLSGISTTRMYAGKERWLTKSNPGDSWTALSSSWSKNSIWRKTVTGRFANELSKMLRREAV